MLKKSFGLLLSWEKSIDPLLFGQFDPSEFPDGSFESLYPIFFKTTILGPSPL